MEVVLRWNSFLDVLTVLPPSPNPIVTAVIVSCLNILSCLFLYCLCYEWRLWFLVLDTSPVTAALAAYFAQQDLCFLVPHDGEQPACLALRGLIQHRARPPQGTHAWKPGLIKVNPQNKHFTECFSIHSSLKSTGYKRDLGTITSAEWRVALMKCISLASTKQ